MLIEKSTAEASVKARLARKGLRLWSMSSSWGSHVSWTLKIGCNDSGPPLNCEASKQQILSFHSGISFEPGDCPLSSVMEQKLWAL